jgi:outer membrane protein TolC
VRHGLAWMCVLGGLSMTGLTEGRPPAPGTAGLALDKTTLAEVRKLQEKRRDVLREALALRETEFRAARGTLDGVIKTSKRLLAAELNLATTGGERIAAHQRHLEKARIWSEVVKARHQAGQAVFADALEAQAAFLAAEIGLRQAGGKPKKVEK